MPEWPPHARPCDRALPEIGLSLALRLLFAFGWLAIAATTVVGVGVRESWRRAEGRRFAEQLARATGGAGAELRGEAQRMARLLEPVCAHDAFVDQTLVGLERRDLDPGRRLAVTQLVPEEMRALELDELTLVSSSGEVLAAGHDPGAAGKTDRALAAEAMRPGGGFRPGKGPDDAALLARCSKSRAGVGIALLGARRLAPVLDRVGRAYAVRLSLVESAPQAAPGEETRVTAPLPELGGMRLEAAVSRAPLERQLADVDRLIALMALAAVLVAGVAALALARSLARPLEALAAQAGEVVRGDPRPVVARGGGREIQAFARAFNQALGDLAALRKRLAVTERIAARREVARQVAHEIKNPLAPIRAAVETLRRLRARRDPAFDEYFDEATRTVLDEVHRIARIVSQFGELDRLPAPRLAAVDPVEIARGVVALHAQGTERVRLDAAAVPKIRADRDQLAQVLTNLVQNGLDAAGDARADPHVLVRVRADGDAVVLDVEDDGPGVPAAIRDRLFEPYATTKAHGTGLGLAIVRRLVLEHGGDVTLEPRQGGGACFRVRLPVDGPPESFEAAPPHGLA